MSLNKQITQYRKNKEEVTLRLDRRQINGPKSFYPQDKRGFFTSHICLCRIEDSFQLQKKNRQWNGCRLPRRQ